tara:strand:- start:1836 stop:1994 length:159 start_codon:yes stop_codon:yes gene_type:complete
MFNPVLISGIICPRSTKDLRISGMITWTSDKVAFTSGAMTATDVANTIISIK